MVVFGATGDLSHRKLIPGALPARRGRADSGRGAHHRRVAPAPAEGSFEDAVRHSLAEHVPADERTEAAMERFLARLSFVTLDAAGDAGWGELTALLAQHPDRIRAFYLAVGPDLFGAICERIGRHGLVTPATRVVVEKPVGKSGASARAVNEAVGRVFEERQIFRIDHYLGKETVQNLMALRFANALFEPVWNAAHIDHVQITVAETLGVEGRAATTTPPARCATWCRTTFCNCSAWRRWSRQPPSTPTPCATRS